LYRIDDPFFRLWFRLVAPHRATLVAGTDAARRQILKLVAQSRAGMGRGRAVDRRSARSRRRSAISSRTIPSLSKLEHEAREVDFGPSPNHCEIPNWKVLRALFVPALPKGAPNRIGAVHLIAVEHWAR